MKNGIIPRIKTSIVSSTHFSESINSQKCAYQPIQVNYLFEQSNTSNLATALQYYINSDHPSHGQKVHSHIFKIGFNPNTNISIKLLILHLKSSCLSYARQMFDQLSLPTRSAYNYMLSGYVKAGKFEESFSLVRRLAFSEERPDGFTFSMILKASTSGGALLMPRRIGNQVHALIVKYDVKADDVLYTALVDSYVKSGRVDYARRVFDLMLEKSVVCSTSMISGYMERGSVEDAEDIFEKTKAKDVVVFNAMIEGYSKSVDTAKRAIDFFIDMQRVDFRPTISTFASIIGACAVLSAYEIGQQVHGQLAKTPIFNDIKMGSALLDMYSKCGRVEDARRVFDLMPLKNVFSWTSMIDGYGKNGNPAEALELFSSMQTIHYVKPNYVTFLSALSACGHAGLVAKGKQIFNSMKTNYSMKPKMEHYACMVDLLGRAGSLNEALKFVTEMPEKPNSDVWAALLSSSRIHDDVEMANIAANELFKLGSDSRPGAYIALSNTLAVAERWDTVSEIREVMKARGISKDTGFSWVGADGNIEGFHDGQRM